MVVVVVGIRGREGVIGIYGGGEGGIGGKGGRGWSVVPSFPTNAATSHPVGVVEWPLLPRGGVR